jgi:hypothetical protein
LHLVLVTLEVQVPTAFQEQRVDSPLGLVGLPLRSSYIELRVMPSVRPLGLRFCTTF